MRVASIVLQYVKVLIWPGLVTTVFVVFRGELKELIPRIKTIKGGPVGEVEFEGTSVQVAMLKSVTAPAEDGSIDPDSATDIVHLQLLFDESPAWAITTAWGIVEPELRHAGEAVNVLPPGSPKLNPKDVGTQGLIMSLSKLGLGLAEASALDSAREIAVRAFESPKEVDGRIAKNYVESTRLVARALRQMAQTAK